jgi:hypothetical protein
MTTATPSHASTTDRSRARCRAVALLTSAVLGVAALAPAVASAGFAIGG